MKLGCQHVGFEGRAIVYADYAALKGWLTGVDFSTALDLDALRQVKDEEEIGYIRRACAIADKAFEDIVHFIRPGRTEIEVAARLEQVMREAGSEKPSFDTIVASGLRGSMPHGTATEKVIEAGDFVTMDYGAKFEGYCSDITRTVCVGEATARQREVYEAVLGTQEMVLAAIAPGKSGKEIDAASREFLKKYDLAQYFGHGLGHSLGLEHLRASHAGHADYRRAGRLPAGLGRPAHRGHRARDKDGQRAPDEVLEGTPRDLLSRSA